MVESIYQGSISITNVTWSDSLTNNNSQIYTKMKNHLEEQMGDALCKDTVHDHCQITILGFSDGMDEGINLTTLSSVV